MHCWISWTWKSTLRASSEVSLVTWASITWYSARNLVRELTKSVWQYWPGCNGVGVYRVFMEGLESRSPGACLPSPFPTTRTIPATSRHLILRLPFPPDRLYEGVRTAQHRCLVSGALKLMTLEFHEEQGRDFLGNPVSQPPWSPCATPTAQCMPGPLREIINICWMNYQWVRL